MKTTLVKTSENSQKALWTLMGYFGVLMALFLVSDLALAQASGGSSTAAEGSLGSVAATITGSMTNVAKLITATSYVAGVGFALMGMLKLKAHKDNPTQVSLSQPIVLLAIAAGLVFLPSLIKTAGKTVWSDSQAASATGEGGQSLGADGSGG